MRFSAIDPALLIHHQEDWQNRMPHCFNRFKALVLHRQYIQKYGQRIAMSHDYVSIVSQSFPWNYASRNIQELRDLRQFIIEDIARNIYYLDGEVTGSVSLQPDDITCRFVKIPEAMRTWEELLYYCLKEQDSSDFDVQIATWDVSGDPSLTQSLTVAIRSGTETEYHYLPLVWDKESWVRQLASQDAWPNLHNCVELYFMSTPAMKNYPGALEHPIPFEWTNTFWSSVENIRDVHLRQELIKAITKRVYGIFDKGLGDELFRGMKRFRVTGFWRVHYSDLGDSLRLEEFGEHDMGM